eukprot:TRINITY_DN2615_c0_g1_i2.p3 TRINITY_DN2615_c0_g1~~TRINITY_DN2615_c0_g1_i2.p3  ORF type:complete len:132 (+),score=51.72 TRINITY_DN2615_c0_g1_i2:707-1102(+)
MDASATLSDMSSNHLFQVDDSLENLWLGEEEEKSDPEIDPDELDSEDEGNPRNEYPEEEEEDEEEDEEDKDDRFYRDHRSRRRYDDDDDDDDDNSEEKDSSGSELDDEDYMEFRRSYVPHKKRSPDDDSDT